MKSFYFAVNVCGPKILQKFELNSIPNPLEFFQDITGGYLIECAITGLHETIGARLDGFCTLINCHGPSSSIPDNLDRDSELSKVRDFLLLNFNKVPFVIISQTAMDDFLDCHDFDWIRNEGSFDLCLKWLKENKTNEHWVLFTQS